MRLMKPLAAVLALAIGATTLVSSADARQWRRHYYHNHHHHGDAFAAGVFGFAAGAFVGSALSQPYYYPRAYYAPRVYRPAPVYYAYRSPRSPDWYSYCASRYRSFNPRTGYYLGYDGQYHLCR